FGVGGIVKACIAIGDEAERSLHIGLEIDGGRRSGAGTPGAESETENYGKYHNQYERAGESCKQRSCHYDWRTEASLFCHVYCFRSKLRFGERCLRRANHEAAHRRRRSENGGPPAERPDRRGTRCGSRIGWRRRPGAGQIL